MCRSIVKDKEKVGKEIQKIFHTTDESDIEKILKKVQYSLGHASSENMKLMMQNSTLWKKIGQSNMMRKINDLMTNCKPCTEMERPSDKRKSTTAARSERFNGRIAIDLSERYDQKLEKKRIICQIIDEYSRVSSARFVEDKTPEEVLRALFACWFSKYGIPEQIIDDSGGEFTSEKWLMMMDMLQIRDRTTAGYSQFSNGIVERHNAVLRNTMSNINVDGEVQFLQATDVLNYSLMAKNSLLNRKGFSPFQIVFGRNVWEDNIENELFISHGTEKMVREHFKIMRDVERKYLEAESNTRIEAIERKKTNNNLNDKFDSVQRGDIVQSFRRGIKSEEQWRGPATVIGIDGTIVILRHVSRVVNSHVRDVPK